MPDLKLSKLPDRTPIKLHISITPDLSKLLNDYAEVYRETYGQTENVVDLIPYMLQSFLDGDRGFVRGRAKS